MTVPSALNCLPGIYIRHVVAAVHGATSELRLLRGALTVCRVCPELAQCPHRAVMNQLINQALTELTDEWGLSLQ